MRIDEAILGKNSYLSIYTFISVKCLKDALKALKKASFVGRENFI